MEKTTVVLMICLIALSGIIGAYAGFELAPKGMITTKFEYVEVPIYVYIHTYERSEIEEVANTLASTRFYVAGVYDCSEFSEALVKQLAGRGYDCGVVHGTYNGTPHDYVWVKVYVESTSGYMINSTQMKLYE